MKHLVTLALAFSATAALAHGNVSCPAMPKEEKKPQMELQKKLEAEGWKVRKVKDYNGCYEVYGIDAAGKKAEVFFNPKTFERVPTEGEKAADKK
jgi:hypothetical protein